MRISKPADEKLSFVRACSAHQISATRFSAWQSEAWIGFRKAHMKTPFLAVTAVAFAAAASLSPALAAARNGSGDSPWPSALQSIGGAPASAAAGAPHYEWQYRYVGHHPRYEGHWVLVQ